MSGTTRYLVAIDDSPGAMEAFDRAIHMMSPGDSISLLHVLDSNTAEQWRFIKLCFEATWLEEARGDSGAVVGDYEVDVRQEQLLQRFRMRAHAHRIECRLQSKRGGPVGSHICAEAVAQEIDIIVVASRGLGAISRAFFGSVSDYVLHNAPCAVLVVQPKLNSISPRILSPRSPIV